ncbi:GxxExxY protein [Bowmanella denitrificans]|uniref:GxxExxY protein n=1 Tax=Bowmanella denitrificans TaxID=366582 RepID=A0ABN0XKP7_9ALTE
MHLTENQLGSRIIHHAIALHKEVGPGLFESVYEVVLADALAKEGYKVERQSVVPIVIRGIQFDEGFRVDLIVEDKVLLELKSVSDIHNQHKKQLLTYLKLTGIKLGYVLNFGAATMREGIVRIVNGLVS